MPMLKTQQEKEMLGRYSSFHMVEQNLKEVVQRLLHNERLKRLLYYTDTNALSLPKLTNEQTLSLLNKQIKLVPRLNVEDDAKPYIIISLDNFEPQPGQNNFKSAILSFDILSPFDYWMLGDFKLRPYAIAGEIDALINKATVGFGIANFIGGKQLFLGNDLGGITLYYSVEAFNEDKQLHPEEKDHPMPRNAQPPYRPNNLNGR